MITSDGGPLPEEPPPAPLSPVSPPVPPLRPRPTRPPPPLPSPPLARVAAAPQSLGSNEPLFAEAVTRTWPVLAEYGTEAEFTDACAGCQEKDVPGGWRPVTRAKFLSWPKWKQKKVVAALEIAPRFSYIFPHAEVQPLPSIDEVDWASCVGLELSSAGSGGIWFVELADKRAVCVKYSRDGPGAIFATLLCQRLQLRCPSMRLVLSESAEGTAALRALQAIDDQRPAGQSKFRSTVASQPYFLVMEYLCGVDLSLQMQPLCADFAQRAFGPLRSDSPSEVELHEHGRAVLCFFGRVIVLDMIINNSDRLPCIWANDGNPGNLVFESGSCEPVAIDHWVTCIDRDSIEAATRQKRAEYLQLVHSTVLALARAPDTEHADFAKIRTILLDGCVGHGWPGLGIDIGVEGTLEIQRGFLEFARSASSTEIGVESDPGRQAQDGQASGITLPELVRIYNQVLNQLKDSPDSSLGQKYNPYGLQRSVRPEFCADVVDTIRAALAEATPGERRANPTEAAVPARSEGGEHDSDNGDVLLPGRERGGSEPAKEVEAPGRQGAAASSGRRGGVGTPGSQAPPRGDEQQAAAPPAGVGAHAGQAACAPSGPPGEEEGPPLQQPAQKARAPALDSAEAVSAVAAAAVAAVAEAAVVEEAAGEADDGEEVERDEEQLAYQRRNCVRFLCFWRRAKVAPEEGEP